MDKLKPYGKSIYAIFFDVDNGRAIEKEKPDDIYNLGITIVYDGADAIANEANAQELKAELNNIFTKAFFNENNNEWQNIELEYCEVSSDLSISVAQARTMSEWNVDQLSFRDQSNQPLYEF